MSALPTVEMVKLIIQAGYFGALLLAMWLGYKLLDRWGVLLLKEGVGLLRELVNLKRDQVQLLRDAVTETRAQVAILRVLAVLLDPKGVLTKLLPPEASPGSGRSNGGTLEIARTDRPPPSRKDPR